MAGASGCLNGLSREVKSVIQELIVLQLYFLFISTPSSSSADLAENIGSQQSNGEDNQDERDNQVH